MKRFLAASVSLLLLACVHVAAQNKVTGTVTDRKGNPIPGVKVEVKGGTESTITELDGTFVLETETPVKKVTVHYVGMQSKSQKVKPDMTIKMSESSWWREKPDKYRWFAGVQVAMPCLDEVKPSYGLMAGMVKEIGWYVKGVYNKMPGTSGTITDYNSAEGWFTGELKESYWNVSAGVIGRLWSPFHLYAGVGYSKRQAGWETYQGSVMKFEPDCYNGLVIDLGVMLKIKKIFINGGVMLNNPDTNYKDVVGCFGVGYCF